MKSSTTPERKLKVSTIVIDPKEKPGNANALGPREMAEVLRRIAPIIGEVDDQVAGVVSLHGSSSHTIWPDSLFGGQLVWRIGGKQNGTMPSQETIATVEVALLVNSRRRRIDGEMLFESICREIPTASDDKVLKSHFEFRVLPNKKFGLNRTDIVGSEDAVIKAILATVFERREHALAES